MIVRTNISSIFKRITLGFASFALVLGSVSAAVPVFLTDVASAVSGLTIASLPAGSVVHGQVTFAPVAPDGLTFHSAYIEFNKGTALNWKTDNTTVGSVALGSILNGKNPKLVVDTSVFGDGLYGIKVSASYTDGTSKAYNAAYTIDNTAPAPVFTAPVAGSIVRGVLPIVLNLNDINPNYTYIEINQNGDWKAATTINGQSNTWNFDTTRLPAGNYTIKVDVTDRAGNWGSVTRNFAIDNDGPVVAVASPLDNSIFGQSSTQMSVQSTASDSNVLAAYYVAVDGVGKGYAYKPANGAMPATLIDVSILSQGVHTLVVRATDMIGNATEVRKSFVVDTIAPVVPSAQTPNGWTNSASVFNWTPSSDSGTAVHYTLQYSRTHSNNVADTTVSNITGNSQVLATALVDGPLFWRVKAIDMAGNESAWSGMQYANLDSQAPSIAVNLTVGQFLAGTKTIAATIGDRYATSFSVGVLSDDAAVTVVAGSKLATPGTGIGSYSWNTKLVADGGYIVRIVATDVIGHTTTKDVVVVVDNKKPELKTPVLFSDGAEAENTTLKGTKTFRIEQSESNNAKIYVEYMTKNTAGDWKKDVGQEFLNTNSADFTVDTEFYGDGQHQVKITSTDKAGNKTGYSFFVNVDSTAPTKPEDLTVKAGEVTLVSPAYTKSLAITTSWKLNSDAAKYEYSIWNSIDDTTSSIFRTDNSYTGTFSLGEGTHSIQVRAIDATDNASEWTVPFFVTYDKTAPVVNLSQDVAYVTEGMTYKLKGVVSDDVELNGWRYQLLDSEKKVIAGAVGYSRLGGSVATESNQLTSVDLTGLADGTYYVRAWAFDKAGNRTGAVVVPNITKFVIYRTQPVVTVNIPAIDDALPVISGTVTEGATIDTVAVDGTELTVTQTADVWSAPVTSLLDNGVHTVVVTGTDVAGNGFTTETTLTEFTTNVVAVADPVSKPVTPLIAATPVTPIAPVALRQPAFVATVDTTATTPEAEVLGASTTKKDATDVAGVSTTKADASKTDSKDGLSAAWWWLLAFPAAGASWWAVAAFRRRNS